MNKIGWMWTILSTHLLGVHVEASIKQKLGESVLMYIFISCIIYVHVILTSLQMCSWILQQHPSLLNVVLGITFIAISHGKPFPMTLDLHFNIKQTGNTTHLETSGNKTRSDITLQCFLKLWILSDWYIDRHVIFLRHLCQSNLANI